MPETICSFDCSACAVHIEHVWPVFKFCPACGHQATQEMPEPSGDLLGDVREDIRIKLAEVLDAVHRAQIGGLFPRWGDAAVLRVDYQLVDTLAQAAAQAALRRIVISSVEAGTKR